MRVDRQLYGKVKQLGNLKTMSQRKLGERHNISQATVSKILGTKSFAEYQTIFGKKKDKPVATREQRRLCEKDINCDARTKGQHSNGAPENTIIGGLAVVFIFGILLWAITR